MRRFLPLATMKVAGRSMMPTITPDRRLLVSRVSYVLDSPRKGHLVIVRHPQGNLSLVKRVIATEGERVYQQYGRLFVGSQQALVSVKDYSQKEEVQEWIVPEGHYFVAGDNLHASTDSRHFGCVEKNSIEGRVIGSFSFDE